MEKQLVFWRQCRGAVESLLVGLLLLALISPAIAQRDNMDYVGELEIRLPTGTTNTILVQAQTPAFDTQCSWYPENSSLANWGKTNTNSYLLRFVDRNITCSPYNAPDTALIGYAKYKVSVGSNYIYVDFRDADYGTLTGYNNYQDVQLYYRPDHEAFLDKFDRLIDYGSTYHIWDAEPKQSAVKIPVTVRNSFAEGYGGTVKVDGTWRDSPYQTLWSVGNHTVEAHDWIPGMEADYDFDYWSDSGSKAHTVGVTVDDFGLVLTAYFIASSRRHDEGESAMRINATAYPNPFNPTATISYYLPSPSVVTLAVFDNLGRQVALLDEGDRNAGEHRVRFDGTNFSSGIYYYRLRAGGQAITRSMFLLK